MGNSGKDAWVFRKSSGTLETEVRAFSEAVWGKRKGRGTTPAGKCLLPELIDRTVLRTKRGCRFLKMIPGEEVPM
jgi:hypothetical protein